MFKCVHTYVCKCAHVCGYERARTEQFKYTYNIIVHNQFISKFYIGTVLSQNVKSVNCYAKAIIGKKHYGIMIKNDKESSLLFINVH